MKLVSEPHLLGHYFGFNKLNLDHSRWIIQCWKAKGDYVLQAHRNSYKTTACLIIGIVWYLMFHPDTTILIVRKEYEGAASTLGAIAKILESEAFQGLYNEYARFVGIPEIKYKLTDNRKDTITIPTKTTITKEGSVEALGIGGAITGRHYDKIFCDDVITLKDRVSKAEREKTKEFVRELQNVKNPGGNIIFTGTPWHKDDAFSILPAAHRYPLGTVSVPDLTPEVIADIRARTTPSLFAANYELKHIADKDKLFADLKYSRFNTECSGIIGIIDTAYSGTHYTSFSLLEFWGGKYIIKGWAWRESIVDLYAKISGLATAHNCGTIYIEENGDKGLAKKAMQPFYPNIVGYTERENKHNKIVGHLKGNWQEIYFDDSLNTDAQVEYNNQIIDYAEGVEPDDAPDNAAAGMRLMKERDIDVKDSMVVTDLSKDYEY